MGKGNLLEERRTRSIIGAFFDAYNGLGFGFLEKICCEALSRELVARGHGVEQEATVPVWYRGQQVGIQRLDMIVDAKIVVEVKSTPLLFKNPTRQLYNYLRATDYEVGLFFHFGREPNFERVVCSNEKKKSITAPSAWSDPNDANLSALHELKAADQSQRCRRDAEKQQPDQHPPRAGS